jgi:hypothetical protein
MQSKDRRPVRLSGRFSPLGHPGTTMRDTHVVVTLAPNPSKRIKSARRRYTPVAGLASVALYTSAGARNA